MFWGRLQTECDGTRAETRFGLPAKRTSPFISAGVVSSVEYWLSWSEGRGRTIVVTLDGLFRVKLKTADYPHHSPLSPSLLLPCVTVCHQIPFPLYSARLLATHSTRMFPFHFPSRASPCAIRFRTRCTTRWNRVVFDSKYDTLNSLWYNFQSYKIFARRASLSLNGTQKPTPLYWNESYPPYRRPFLYPQPEDVPCRGDRDPLNGAYPPLLKRKDSLCDCGRCHFWNQKAVPSFSYSKTATAVFSTCCCLLSSQSATALFPIKYYDFEGSADSVAISFHYIYHHFCNDQHFCFSLIRPSESPIICCSFKKYVVTMALLIRAKVDAKSLSDNRLRNFRNICLQTYPMT